MGYVIVIARLPGIYGNVNRPLVLGLRPWTWVGLLLYINPWPHALTIKKVRKVLSLPDLTYWDICDVLHMCMSMPSLLIESTDSDKLLISP